MSPSAIGLRRSSGFQICALSRQPSRWGIIRCLSAEVLAFRTFGVNLRSGSIYLLTGLTTPAKRIASGLGGEAHPIYYCFLYSVRSLFKIHIITPCQGTRLELGLPLGILASGRVRSIYKTKDKEARMNGGYEQSLRGCRLNRRLSHRST